MVGAGRTGPADRHPVDRLGRVVEAEARRMLSQEQFEPDPRLVAQGWQRRFMADGRRAVEAMDLYRELGYEVRAEPVGTEEVADECGDCQLLMALRFTTIYTRSPREEL
jgi:hypothetical protein